LIYSDECYLKSGCYKYSKDKSCESCSVYCPKLFRTNLLFDKSLLSEKQRENVPMQPTTDSDAQAFEELGKIGRKIVEFVNSGNNLYICSKTPGNGKTTWAVKLMQKFFNQIWADTDDVCRGIFINVPWFLLSLKEDISNKSESFKEVKSNIFKADLVIWDDIATKFATEFEQENLLSIIDYRMREGKSNIFTSNQLPSELKVSMGERLASRVATSSKQIILNGADMRGDNKWQ